MEALNTLGNTKFLRRLTPVSQEEPLRDDNPIEASHDTISKEVQHPRPPTTPSVEQPPPTPSTRPSPPRTQDTSTPRRSTRLNKGETSRYKDYVE